MPWTKKILASLIALSFATTSIATAQTPEVCPNFNDCECYNTTELAKIRRGILDLRKCEIRVEEQDALIQERLTLWQGSNHEQAWWQDPYFVWGGITVSFSTGLLMGVLWAQNKD